MCTKLLPWVELMKEDFSLVNRHRSGNSVWWGVHHEKVDELRGLVRLMIGGAAIDASLSNNRDTVGELYVNVGDGYLMALYKMTSPKSNSHPWYVHLSRISEASKRL